MKNKQTKIKNTLMTMEIIIAAPINVCATPSQHWELVIGNILQLQGTTLWSSADLAYSVAVEYNYCEGLLTVFLCSFAGNPTTDQ